MKKLETAANVATLTLACVATILLLRTYVTAPKVHAPIGVGDSVVLPDTDWSRPKSTLVLALQVGCRYCAESASFYAKIAEKLAGTGVHLTAVFPQSVSEARTYLARMNIRVEDVRQASLPSVNVYGTPTLILVDRAGRVIKTWVGRLRPDGEDDVIATVTASTKS